MTEPLIAWTVLVLSLTALALSLHCIRRVQVTVGLWDVREPTRFPGDEPGEDDYPGRD